MLQVLIHCMTEWLKNLKTSNEQLPLASFTMTQLKAAFNFAPDLEKKYTRRGTMSIREYRKALKLVQRRILAEQARRKAAKTA